MRKYFSDLSPEEQLRLIMEDIEIQTACLRKSLEKSHHAIAHAEANGLLMVARQFAELSRKLAIASAS